MRVWVLLAVLCLAAAQPYPEPCEDDGPPRVKFAQARTMEGDPLDIGPYLDIPQDFQTGRAAPMPVVTDGIETICPFGVKCPPPPPSVEEEMDEPDVAVADSGVESDSPVVESPLEHDQQAEEVDEVMTVDEVEDDVEAEDDDQEPEVVSAGPDGLTVASRVEGSVVEQSINDQHQAELDQAVEEATQRALEMLPPPPEVNMSDLPDDTVLSDDYDPNAGMGSDDGGVGDSAPEVVIHDTGNFVPPPATPTPTPTPTSTPDLYQPTIELEFEPCDDPPLLPRNSVDDMPTGSYPISALRGQGVALHTELTLPSLPFTTMPPASQEAVVDVTKLDMHLDTPRDVDNSMADPGKFQVFALKERSYAASPGVRKSLRKTSLAGDSMGTYDPSIQGLDQISRSASMLAGRILAEQPPLKSTFGPQEFASNELSTNVTWALMNDPIMPSSSPSPSPVPVPLAPAPASVMGVRGNVSVGANATVVWNVTSGTPVLVPVVPRARKLTSILVPHVVAPLNGSTLSLNPDSALSFMQSLSLSEQDAVFLYHTIASQPSQLGILIAIMSFELLSDPSLAREFVTLSSEAFALRCRGSSTLTLPLFLSSSHLSARLATAVFASMDTDASGSVDIYEFSASGLYGFVSLGGRFVVSDVVLGAVGLYAELAKEDGWLQLDDFRKSQLDAEVAPEVVLVQIEALVVQGRVSLRDYTLALQMGLLAAGTHDAQAVNARLSQILSIVNQLGEGAIPSVAISAYLVTTFQWPASIALTAAELVLTDHTTDQGLITSMLRLVVKSLFPVTASAAKALRDAAVFVSGSSVQPEVVQPEPVSPEMPSVPYDSKYVSTTSSGMTPLAIANSDSRMPEPEGDGFVDALPMFVPQVPESSRNTYIGNHEYVRKSGIALPTQKSGQAMPLHLDHNINSVSQTEANCDDDKKEEEDDQNESNSTSSSPVREILSEVAEFIPAERCRQRLSCDVCTSDTSCVWCPELNICASGSSDGPESQMACATNFLFGMCENAHYRPPAPITRSSLNVAQVVDRME